MTTIDIAGTPHFYHLTPPVADPNAPTLVFVHGWLLSHRQWQPLLEDLACDFRCLSYDLRGFGDSQPPATGAHNGDLEAYSLEAYAADLEGLLDRLNLDRVWLVGHSLGGSIALWGGDRCPERVRGIICINAGGGIYLKEEFERFRAAGEQIVRFRPPWLQYLPLLDSIFARTMVAQPLQRQWGQQRLADFLRADRAAALGSLLESTTESEVHRLPRLVARLQQPAYFLAGERDRVMEPKYVRHLASFHPLFSENLIEIASCGHMAMLEQPAATAAIVREILARH